MALGHARNSLERRRGLIRCTFSGAALHQAIAGPLVPAGLPNREKFARLLRGRMGLPARLAAAARSRPAPLARGRRRRTRTADPRLPGIESRLAARPQTRLRAAIASLAEKLATERSDPLLGI